MALLTLFVNRLPFFVFPMGKTTFSWCKFIDVLHDCIAKCFCVVIAVQKTWVSFSVFDLKGRDKKNSAAFDIFEISEIDLT